MGVAILRTMKKVFLSIVAFFGLSAGKNLNVTLEDNPLLTCYTNPCVDVDGFGKIMGTKKVPQCGNYLHIFLSLRFSVKLISGIAKIDFT